MNTLDLILIAFSLTSTVFSLSLVANVQKCLSVKEKFRLTTMFSFFPVSLLWMGYWAGYYFLQLMKWANPWIFIILILIIGIRMIIRSLKTKPENRTYNYGDFKVIFALSIALGLPAFILGMGFSFTKIELYPFLIFMMIFGLILSLLGISIGKRKGDYSLGNKAVFLGGVIFVGLAIKQIILLLGFI